MTSWAFPRAPASLDGGSRLRVTWVLVIGSKTHFPAFPSYQNYIARKPKRQFAHLLPLPLLGSCGDMRSRCLWRLLRSGSGVSGWFAPRGGRSSPGLRRGEKGRRAAVSARPAGRRGPRVEGATPLPGCHACPGRALRETALLWGSAGAGQACGSGPACSALPAPSALPFLSREPPSPGWVLPEAVLASLSPSLGGPPSPKF